MKKRLICLVFVFLMIFAGTMCANAENNAWNYGSTWVVYDGVLNMVRDDGVEMTFVVEYRRPFMEEEAQKCFWIGYVENTEELPEMIVYMPLPAEYHDLVFSDDGEYRLLVEEEALEMAYELWKGFN